MSATTAINAIRDAETYEEARAAYQRYRHGRSTLVEVHFRSGWRSLSWPQERDDVAAVLHACRRNRNVGRVIVDDGRRRREYRRPAP